MARKSAQVVNFEGEFVSQSKQYFQKCGLKATNYHVVSIIGCQATGKSTLLNMLFGTEFEMLDSSKGRFQTTKGIQVSSDTQTKTLIVDIEGTDSQARGEDGVAFEHMSALFALAVSDLLMVNMWTSEVGRYKAASIGLLKTIFEVNLKLFNPESQKRILFVLRDFNQQTNNLVKLKQQISKTMEEVWKSIKKPPAYALLSVFECFEFEFVSVSVKDFEPVEFERDVSDLRSRFRDSQRENYLFRGNKTDIPVDGVFLYFSEIWSVIKNDKDINIPSQKEMLSSLRCNELKLEALKSFTESIEDLKAVSGKQLVKDFAKTCSDKVNSALDQYDQQACNYELSVYKTTRSELNSLVLEHIKDMVHSQLRFLVYECFEAFKAQVNLPRDFPVENFTEVVSEEQGKVTQSFLKRSSEVVVEGINSEEFKDELDKMIVDKVQTLKENQVYLLEKEIESSFSGDFSQTVHKTLEKSYQNSFWKNLKELQTLKLQDLEPRVLKVLAGLDYSYTEVYLEKARSECLQVLLVKIQKYISNLTEHMTKCFNRFFFKDRRGVPRDWRTTEIDQVFTEAQEKALKMLENLKFSQLQEEPQELIPDYQYELTKDHFLKNAELAYRDSVHLKEFGYSRYGVPKWYLLLLLILGWNEILWVLQSPWILYPLLLVVSMVVLLFSIGLGHIPRLFTRQVLRKLG